MPRDNKSNISRESSKKSKKAQELASRRKTNNHSDSDDAGSSESENDEMDVHEYRKFLSKIFPSKHLNKKIKAGEKIKELLEEEQGSDDEEEESVWDSFSESEEETPKKAKKLSNKNSKPNKKPVSRQEKNSSEDESDSYDDASYEDDEEEDQKPVKKTNKKSKTNSKTNGKSNSKAATKHSKKVQSDSEDSSEEEEDAEKKSSGKFNIIFTIGGAEDSYDEESLSDDSDYDEDDSCEDTEDEDVSVSSSENESDESYEEDDSEQDNKVLTRKQQKSLKQKTEKQQPVVCQKPTKNGVEPSNANVEDKDQSSDEQLMLQLRELFKKNNNNETVKKCLEVCEADIKNKKAKEVKKSKKQKAKNARIFKKIIRDKNTMNDYAFFEKLELADQKKIIKELREINKITRIEKPYRMSLLESNIPTLFKGAAMKKINSLRYMEPGSGEFYKIKNWVDTFMRIPFGEYKTLPVSIEDGVDKCHEFMETAQKTLDSAVYGLNDAKMQIMQMLGQLVTNPAAIGTAIAIHGPPGTGKTSLVKEGISKILNRPFAFIALGGATDSSFLEGHSYTYEGSMWGKIVQILIDSKCMNPVIYFDELDKISDTPKGEEIAGILTHLTDTSQNSQFHDKYFAEIDFDLSKCLFIFSYNDESKVNPILKDRMYRIQTKGYNQKQKTNISSNYLLPKIREQVKFTNEDIIIPNETLHYIIDNLCNKEDGVRNLKRCLEIIYTKLNLYRLMKPGTNLFEEEMALKVEFPFTVTNNVVDKLIKNDKDKYSALNSMYI
jgi:ATP-dependent Lon protease